MTSQKNYMQEGDFVCTREPVFYFTPEFKIATMQKFLRDVSSCVLTNAPHNFVMYYRPEFSNFFILTRRMNPICEKYDDNLFFKFHPKGSPRIPKVTDGIMATEIFTAT